MSYILNSKLLLLRRLGDGTEVVFMDTNEKKEVAGRDSWVGTIYPPDGTAFVSGQRYRITIETIDE
jgi:hypothetical protein